MQQVRSAMYLIFPSQILTYTPRSYQHTIAYTPVLGQMLKLLASFAQAAINLPSDSGFPIIRHPDICSNLGARRNGSQTHTMTAAESGRGRLLTSILSLLGT